MSKSNEERDRLAEERSQLCYCAGFTCSGYGENTKKLVKWGWDACEKYMREASDIQAGAEQIACLISDNESLTEKLNVAREALGMIDAVGMPEPYGKIIREALEKIK